MVALSCRLRQTPRRSHRWRDGKKAACSEGCLASPRGAWFGPMSGNRSLGASKLHVFKHVTGAIEGDVNVATVTCKRRHLR